MADIRIKDLTTTASSTASDDFIAVDGATNGTRKLNAYSPSFGGNATVAGAAYVGGNLVIGSTSQITNTASVASGTRLTLNTEAQQGIDIFRSDANANFSGIRFRNSANSATNAQIGWNGTTLRLDAATVEIPGTTASTSTSTGALVVSGGVGVAGALYVGSKGQFQSNDDALSLKYSTDGGSCLLAWKNTSGTTLWSIGGGIDTRQDELVFRRGSTTVLNLNNSNNATFAGTLTVNNSFGVGAAPTSSWASGYYALEVGNTSTKRAALFANGDNNLWLLSNAYFDGSSFKRFAASSATGYEQANGEHKWSYAASGSAGASISFTTGMTLNSSGNLQIAATTASTSTSTGALVVSGGVGVAGAIYLGGLLVSSGSNGGLATESRDGSGYRTTWYNPTGDDMQLDFAGIGTKFTITSAGDTTIAGKITTSAPTGGAGAWELGTYSSTAPSATGYVTIEIGGTVYKLLASNV